MPDESNQFLVAEDTAAEVSQDRRLVGIFTAGLLEGAGRHHQILEKFGDLGYHHRK